MAATGLSAAAAAERLKKEALDSCVVACDNSPTSTTLSGAANLHTYLECFREIIDHMPCIHLLLPRDLLPLNLLCKRDFNMTPFTKFTSFRLPPFCMLRRHHHAKVQAQAQPHCHVGCD